MFIQDSKSRIMSRSPFGSSTCRWTTEGDPTQGEKQTQPAETDLHVRPYAERHMRMYADTATSRHTDPPPAATAAAAPRPTGHRQKSWSSTGSWAAVRVCPNPTSSLIGNQKSHCASPSQIRGPRRRVRRHIDRPLAQPPAPQRADRITPPNPFPDHRGRHRRAGLQQLVDTGPKAKGLKCRLGGRRTGASLARRRGALGNQQARPLPDHCLTRSGMSETLDTSVPYDKVTVTHCRATRKVMASKNAARVTVNPIKPVALGPCWAVPPHAVNASANASNRSTRA